MANSQFNSPATRNADGTIEVTGRLTVDPMAKQEEVKLRFLLVQGDVVVEGEGSGREPAWSGTTAPGQRSLQAAAAQAIGLAIVVKKEPPGFETFTWSEQIELQ